MASMKKIIDCNEFWPTLKDEARRRGWGIGEFMTRCRIPRQRYSEFNQGRSLTGLYINKIMEGLNLKQEELEQKAGKKFSPEQIRERKIESWVAAHRDIVEAMVDDPALLPIVRAIIERQSR